MPGPSGLGKRDEDEPMPGPSGTGQQYEDGGDLSASASDWDPEDDKSGGSEAEMTVKKIMPRKRRHQRKYFKLNKKTKTPANKAKDVAGNVNPRKIFQQIQNTQKESVEISSIQQKVLQNEMVIESIKKIVAASQRHVSGESFLGSPTVRDTVETITQTVITVMKNWPELKECLGPEEQSTNEIHTNSFIQSTPQNKIQNESVENSSVELCSRRSNETSKAKDVTGIENLQKIFQQTQNTQKESVEISLMRQIVLQNEMLTESIKKIAAASERHISSERLPGSPTVRDTVGTVTDRLLKIIENRPKLKKRPRPEEQSNNEMHTSSSIQRIPQNKMEIESIKKNVAVLERHISGERLLRSSAIKDNVGTITETVIKMLKNGPKLKKRPRPEEQSNNEMHTSSSIQSTPQFKEESDEDKENINNDTSVKEEFNKSDDDVLISNKYRKVTETPEQKEEVDEEMIPIGSGRTLIPQDKFRNVNWKSYTMATRTLLVAVFTRSVLATHSLTGKKSAAFPNKKAKMCLDETKVADIVMEVTDRFDVPDSVVRSVVTTKCADESKMLKIRNKTRRLKKSKQTARGVN